MIDLPKSFSCTTCRMLHLFGAWYAAHAFEKMTHTCEKCGAVHTVYDYKVTLTTPGRKPNGGI